MLDQRGVSGLDFRLFSICAPVTSPLSVMVSLSPASFSAATRSDHYARAWSSVLAGGSINGGQVIGKTDRDGATVTERPITVADFMATVCRILGIDYTKKNTTPSGQPIRLVDKDANPIKEVLG